MPTCWLRPWLVRTGPTSACNKLTIATVTDTSSNQPRRATHPWLHCSSSRSTAAHSFVAFWEDKTSIADPPKERSCFSATSRPVSTGSVSTVVKPRLAKCCHNCEVLRSETCCIIALMGIALQSCYPSKLDLADLTKHCAYLSIVGRCRSLGYMLSSCLFRLWRTSCTRWHRTLRSIETLPLSFTTIRAVHQISG